METLRTELNSNEKLALAITGMEGTGQHLIVNGEAADKTLLREKQERFNTAVDELEDKFSKHNAALESYAKSLSEDMNGVEIMPMYGYALIKPFEQNPFKKIKTTKVVNGCKVKSSIELTVVNCYTQFMYGKNHTDGVSKPLDYEALTLCLKKINHMFKGKHIGLPGFIGGGLAGGDPSVIRLIIQKELKDMNVTIVFLEQNKHLMLNEK